MKENEIHRFIQSAPDASLHAIREEIERELSSRAASPKGPMAAISGKILTHTDGASRGNPGKAGIGVVIFDEKGKVILEDCRFIGECTNNEAEYRALILALERAREITGDTVECYMDSELVVRQLSGRYAVKSENMAKFFQQVRDLAGSFRHVSFHHVRREHPRQQIADKLANKGIDDARR